MRSNIQLRPYQKAGVEWLTDGEPTKLLADDMGLGKTIQVIFAANRAKLRRIVIVCPATIKINWARQIAQHLDRRGTFHIVQTSKDDIPAAVDVIIVNYDLMIRPVIKTQLKEIGKTRGFDLVVFDEARALKNMEAKRTKTALGRQSFIHHSERVWLLDGTPVPNRPIEIFPILSVLAPNIIKPYNTYQSYGQYFCKGRRDIFGWNMNGASNIKELSERLTGSNFYLRRTKEEVMEELPAIVETVVEVDVPVDAVLRDTSTEYTATVRRELGLVKIPAAIEYVSSMVNAGNKVVVFAHHRSVIEGLHEGLASVEPQKLYGGMTTSQKQDAIDAFIVRPNCKVLVAQTLAGGSGVDGLQSAAAHIVFVEVDWSPGVMDQAVDRLRRIGQKAETVFVHYLTVPGTHDEVMRRTLKFKSRIISQLIQSKHKEASMTIEESLQSIAASLEKIAAGMAPVTLPEPSALGEASAGQVVPVKPAPKSKKPTKKTEATESDIADEPDKDELPPDPPVEPVAPVVEPPSAERILTLNDALAEVSVFLGGSQGEEREQRKGLIRDGILLKEFGVSQTKDLPESEYGRYIELLKKGPEHYAA